MSHHFDSPSGREDGRINLCDLFVFAGENGSTVLIMTVNPDAGLSSPTTLRDEALYEFKIDLDGDDRADLALRFIITNGDEGVQHASVLLAADETARAGTSGTTLGGGRSGETIILAGGGRAWFGLASDPFVGNAPALMKFFSALGEGRFDLEPFEHRANAFAGRNVSALVVELPPAILLGAPSIGVWSAISLHGHAPQRQVARAGRPLIKHVFVRDEHARAHLDEDAPQSDWTTARAAAIANVATVTRLAGTASDPEAYARSVTESLFPDILPNRPGSVATFAFSNGNGRSFRDPVFDIAFTLLANQPVAGSVAPDSSTNARPFPYVAPANQLAQGIAPLSPPAHA